MGPGQGGAGAKACSSMLTVTTRLQLPPPPPQPTLPAQLGREEEFLVGVLYLGDVMDQDMVLQKT